MGGPRLAPAHLDGLVNAGTALGPDAPGSSPATIFVHGRTLSVTQWRAADGGDFLRARDAYATASFVNDRARAAERRLWLFPKLCMSTGEPAAAIRRSHTVGR